MAIAIYEAASDGRHYWAEPTAPATVRNLAAGAWVLFADSPSTPPPNEDPLDAAMAERATDPTSAFSVVQGAASVAAVEDATTVAPTGAWDFAQAPTVAGAPLSGGGGAAAPAATSTVKGIVRLAGDLGGTADAPTVPGLAGKVDSSTYTAGIAGAKDRANHTGTQTSATISDLTEAVQDIVGAFFGAGTGAAVTYNDAANTITITATGTSDPEAIRDAIGAALIGVGNISVAVNDAGDTITISTTATANSTDAQLRDRSTHTGTEPIGALPAGTTLTVLKSGGVWPTSYSATGAPVYTGGTASAGVRPTARTDIIVAWKGADPSPAIVSSGIGGMLNNVDYRLVTS